MQFPKSKIRTDLTSDLPVTIIGERMVTAYFQGGSFMVKDIKERIPAAASDIKAFSRHFIRVYGV